MGTSNFNLFWSGKAKNIVVYPYDTAFVSKIIFSCDRYHEEAQKFIKLVDKKNGISLNEKNKGEKVWIQMDNKVVIGITFEGRKLYLGYYDTMFYIGLGVSIKNSYYGPYMLIPNQKNGGIKNEKDQFRDY